VAKYTAGLKLLADGDRAKVPLYNNLALCQIKLERWADAVESCDAALKLAPMDVKALYRRERCIVLSSRGGTTSLAIF
jgi:hypothetical protein